MDKQKFFINSRASLEAAFRYAAQFGYEKAYQIEIRPMTRTLEQNRLLWAMLTDISNQVNWHGQKLSQDDWKNVFSSALNKQRVVPNIDNSGFVVLGRSTSKMTVAEMTEMIELMYAFAAEQGVKFNG